MMRFSFLIILLGLIFPSFTFCMEEALTFQGIITHIERKNFPANGVVIYDVLLEDGTKIMTHVVTGGSLKGRAGMQYRNSTDDSTLPMRAADDELLQKLYAPFNAESDNHICGEIYEDLIPTLDAAYIKANPQQLAIFIK